MEEKDAFHILKLSLFSARLLFSIDEERTRIAEINRLVSDEIRKNHIQEPITLINQSTLGHAYICLVLGWEYIRNSKHKKKFIIEFTKRFNIEQINIVANPYNKIINQESLLIVIRNALAHRSINIIGDGIFEFYTKNVKLQMTFHQLFSLCDQFLFSWNEVIYPTA